MLKKESDVYAALRRHVLKKYPGAFVGRVENSVEPGWPDVHMAIPCDDDPVSIWAELKFTRGPAGFLRPDYRPGQVAWAKRYTRAGGNWILVVGCPTGIYYTWTPLAEYTMEQYIPLASL